MTGRQLGVLVILAVLLLLVILATLVFGLGVFDGSLVPGIPTEPSSYTAGEVSSTPSPGAPVDQTSLPTPGGPSYQGTGTPSAISTVYTSTPATQIATLSHTLTPPADICDLLDLRFLSATSSVAAWRLQNHSETALTITRIEIDWPKSNDAIFNTILNGKTIWAGEDQIPPTIMTAWIGDPEDRSVDRLARLEFLFGTLAAPGGYDLYLWFENGCEVSAAN